MLNESDNPFDYVPTGPTQRSNSQATRRLDAILAQFHAKPEMIPAPSLPSSAPAQRKSEDESPPYEHLCRQLAAIASGPVADRYELDCAMLGLNDMDGEESVRALINLWKQLQKPSRRIFLLNASEGLLTSLRTKNLLNGIFLPADVTRTATAE